MRREGDREARWVLLDYVDIVVHVQHSEERVFYALERLWKDCPELELPEDAEATRGKAEEHAKLRAEAAAERRTDELELNRRERQRQRPGPPHRPVAARPDRLEPGAPLPGLHGHRADRDRRRPRPAGPPGCSPPCGRTRSSPPTSSGPRPPPPSWPRSPAWTVTYDEGLRETYAGVWQGLTHEEIIARLRRAVRRVEARRAGAPRRRRAGDRGRRPGRPGRAAARREAARRRHARRGQPRRHHPHHHRAAARPGARTTGRALGGLSNCCWSVLGEGARGWRLLEHNAGTLPEPVLGDDD